MPDFLSPDDWIPVDFGLIYDDVCFDFYCFVNMIVWKSWCFTYSILPMDFVFIKFY